MDILRGVALVAFIVCLAGGIAYIGDRVGHQVGRRRLTLFGLRPRYTSTIVAVGTGMVIALIVVLAAIFASEYVKTAFFRLGEVNNRINVLQAQADALSSELKNSRNEQIIVQNGQPIAPPAVIFPTQSEPERASAVRQFFEDTVTLANRQLVPAGLRPYPKKVTEPDVAEKLRQELTQIDALLLRGPVLILPVAGANLFNHDAIQIAVNNYSDTLLYARGAVVASIDVDGQSQLDVQRLTLLARSNAVARGMPAPYAFPLVNYPQAGAIAQQVLRGRGRFRIVAKAAQEVFPHSGALPLDFAVTEAARK